MEQNLSSKVTRARGYKSLTKALHRRVKETWQKVGNGMKDIGKKDLEKGDYPAALRVTAPLMPGVALLITIVLYLVSKDVAKIIRVPDAIWKGMHGDFAVLSGLLTGLLVWFVVAGFYYRYTTADFISRRNYNKLKERLDYLKIRVDVGKIIVSQKPSPDAPGNCSSQESDLESMRRQALARAEKECEAIQEGLGSKGMPVVTGLTYIELWHRVHHAEEALIKIEPYDEVIEGAMRDKSRLANANMENRAALEEQLDKAVRKIEQGANESLSILKRPEQTPENIEEQLDKAVRKIEQGANEPENIDAQVTQEDLMKARTMLCEVRYEINNFRDTSWEGLVNLRNSLADTVVLLGLSTYALLTLAILLEAPYKAIIWAVTYFLIGAIAGLFARAQAEWGAETAVDDFGLSKTRLLQIPWLSGLAAVGGVLVTSILDPQSTSVVDLTTVFDHRPVLLFIAAAFGITPNLLIRKLDDQADKSKDDLESTETSQSTEHDQRSPSGRRSFSARGR